MERGHSVITRKVVEQAMATILPESAMKSMGIVAETVARERIAAGDDVTYLCQNCGYAARGFEPAVCAVCGAPPEQFEKLDKEAIKKLAPLEGALQEIASGFEADLDGVVALRDGGYVVTAWVGLIYHVSDRGDVRLLLDSRSRQVNTADIGYDPVTHMLYVPTFSANSVRAYRLRGAHEKTGE